MKPPFRVLRRTMSAASVVDSDNKLVCEIRAGTARWWEKASLIAEALNQTVKEKTTGHDQAAITNEDYKHLLAEKDKRIEKLRGALKFYSGGEMSDIDMDIFDKIRLNTKDPKHVYVEWVDTEWLCNPARAALQEDGK